MAPLRLPDPDAPHRFMIVQGPIKNDVDPRCLRMDRCGVLEECSMRAVGGRDTQLHVLINSSGGRVGTRDRVIDVMDGVAARGGFVFSYVRDAAASAAASIAFAADSVSTLPTSHFLWHAAVPQAKLGEVPKEYTVSEEDRRFNREDIYGLLGRARTRVARTMRQEFASVVADPDNQREEISWSAETLAAAALVRVFPNRPKLWAQLRSNTGWTIYAGGSPIQGFFFSTKSQKP